MSARASATEDLAVESATGVDVRMRLVGPGGRAFAFVIDWLARLVLSLAWYVLAALLYNREWSLSPPLEFSSNWFAWVLLPSLVLNLLYHPILEVTMRGRTPGKRIAGLRIVDAHGGTPSVGALLLRNVFRLIDGFPGLYCVGLVCVFVTARNVRIGDMAAGTLLVYESSVPDVLDPVPAGPVRRVDPVVAEIAGELVARWPALDDAARARLGRALLMNPTVPPSVRDHVPNDSPVDDATLRRTLTGLATGDVA